MGPQSYAAAAAAAAAGSLFGSRSLLLSVHLPLYLSVVCVCVDHQILPSFLLSLATTSTCHLPACNGTPGRAKSMLPYAMCMCLPMLHTGSTYDARRQVSSSAVRRQRGSVLLLSSLNIAFVKPGCKFFGVQLHSSITVLPGELEALSAWPIQPASADTSQPQYPGSANSKDRQTIPAGAGTSDNALHCLSMCMPLFMQLIDQPLCSGASSASWHAK